MMNRDNSTVVQNEVDKEVETSTLSDISTSTNHTKVSNLLFCKEEAMLNVSIIFISCINCVLLLFL
jgi:hypothetical protein